ncbi:MAG: 3-methyl-2-oxobutanoate dehydrogenase subunit beta, partial [Clostridiales bacterium]|nr:3-methyl-2-oxobutanoate dehydrogenase subunit beta [Clostridiales bacterium]
GAERKIVTSLHLDPESLERTITARNEKYDVIRKKETRYSVINPDADIIIVAYGTIARIVRSIIDEHNAEKEGFSLGLFCPLTLFPFPETELYNISKGKKAVFTVEMSSGQMVEDVRLAVLTNAPVKFWGRNGGIVPSAEEISAQAKKIWEAVK